MGTQTYGKGLVQAFAPTGYNGKIKITSSRYYTPSGRCVQAIDYGNRNQDGSVGYVPDSLKKAFKTKLGRIVYDGGGITPDSIIKSRQYSRPALSLVMNDIIGDYANIYYTKNNSIKTPKEFVLSNKEYEDFVEYASSREFDSRSTAQTYIDQMLKSAKNEGLYELSKKEFDALEKQLNISKKQMLELKVDEIKPLLEEEIVQKYYFVPGRVETILKTDEQLKEALLKWK